MQNNPTVMELAPDEVVGSSPDKMAAVLQVAVWNKDLHEHYSKHDAIDHLCSAGFTMSDIVENIDDAIMKERGPKWPLV